MFCSVVFRVFCFIVLFNKYVIPHHMVGKKWKAQIVFKTPVTNVPGFLPLLQFLLLYHKRSLVALFHSLN